MSDPATYKAVILADSPLLYLPLDAIDAANDQSGNGRSGAGLGGITLGGSGSGPGGVLATSTTFDNTNDGVALSYSPFTNGTVRSYEAWVKRTANTDLDTILSSTGTSAKFIWRMNSGTNDMTLFMDAVASGTRSAIWSAPYTAGAWHHLLLVVDQTGGTAQLYVDGLAFSTAQTLVNSTAYNASPDFLQIGSNNTTGQNPWNGQIAHVAVYNGDLGARAVVHYNWGLATAASLLPDNTGLPQANNFPAESNLPRGDNRAVQW